MNRSTPGIPCGFTALLIALAALTALSALPAAAQLPDASPTRPSATDNAFLTAPGHLEIETGLLLGDGFYSIPTLLKASLINKLEFGFLMSGIINHRSKPVTSTDVGDPGVQAKYQFMNEGNTAIAGVARLDFADPDARFTAYVTPSLTPIIGRFDATLGLATGGGTTSLIYAVAFSPPMPKPVGIFAEFHGESASNYTPFFFDGGVSFAITPDFVLDAGFGVGLNDDAPDWQFQAGLTKVLAKIL